MEKALSRAGVSREEVGYVNAHGTGTPLNDPAEAHAIRGALGPQADQIPVSSIKGAIGHLMSAAGAVELASCLLAFQRNLLPGTAHHRELDPQCPLQVIGERPLHAAIDVALSNSFGFGGQNVCLALGRDEGPR
jgi:3-oxoacyl-[acyl-carrier-protein] synthase II